MRILPKQPNESGAYPPIQTWDELTPPVTHYEVVCKKSEYFNGFIVPIIENDKVIDWTCNTELWEAWKAVPIEKLREDKLNSIDGMCSLAIYAGLDINGKHYYFTERFQSDIKGLLILMQQGFIGPFLIKETDGKRYPYTADQIKIIANVMYEWIQVNLSYNDLLPMWINREADEAVLNGIHYGSALPSDLTQELATKLASVGVDVTKYAAMFG